MTRRLILFQAAYLRCLKGPLWKTFHACLIVPSSKTVSGDEYQQLFAKSESEPEQISPPDPACLVAAAKLQWQCAAGQKWFYTREEVARLAMAWSILYWLENDQRQKLLQLASFATSSHECNLFVSEQ